MNKHQFKEKVLDAARVRQREIIDDFRKRIDEIKSSEQVVNEGQYELDRRALDEEGFDMLDKLADELNLAVEEVDVLDRMKVGDKLHDAVSLGSVVKTDRRTFFPSVSIEEFRAGGEELFGISEKAPLYGLMKGKKTGDTFRYDGSEYKILDVY